MVMRIIPRMALRTLTWTLLCLGVALPTSSPSISADDACLIELKLFVEEAKAADAKAARARVTTLEQTCDLKRLTFAKAGLAKLHARLAHAAYQDGEAPASVLKELETWRRYGDHWELQRELGRLSSLTGDHTKAAQYFMHALDLIEDPFLTPQLPLEQTILDLHASAADALSLSYVYVAARTTRGEPRAYFRRQLRGVRIPTKRPQLTFITNQTELDDLGKKAVGDLNSVLRHEAPDSVIIIGHADHRGGDQFNLDLSKGRVIAIAGKLRELGYRGSIESLFCGERVSADITDPHLRTEEAILRLNRRVEVYYTPEDMPEHRYEPCVRTN